MECVSRRTLGTMNQPPSSHWRCEAGSGCECTYRERLVAPTASIPLDDESSSDSGSLSRPTLSSLDSSPGPRQRVRRLACRALSSYPEEASNSTDEGVTAVPALEFPALSAALDAILTEAVNISVFHRSQVETDKAAASGASPVIVRTSRARGQLSREQRGGISQRTSPCGAEAGTPNDRPLSSRPVTSVKSSRVDWTPGESGFDWAPIETDSWEKFEDAAWQAAQGATKKAVDYAMDVMELLRMDVDERMKWRNETLWEARDSEEFRQPGQVENLMGRARYLWEHDAEFKKKIVTLEAQQQELEGQQARTAGEMQQLRDQIKELQEEKGRLRQQLEDARAPSPPMEPNSQKTASKGSDDTET